jgi:hypothetical protein
MATSRKRMMIRRTVMFRKIGCGVVLGEFFSRLCEGRWKLRNALVEERTLGFISESRGE